MRFSYLRQNSLSSEISKSSPLSNRVLLKNSDAVSFFYLFLLTLFWIFQPLLLLHSILAWNKSLSLSILHLNTPSILRQYPLHFTAIRTPNVNTVYYKSNCKQLKERNLLIHLHIPLKLIATVGYYAFVEQVNFHSKNNSSTL